jgi:hypothetical protein
MVTSSVTHLACSVVDHHVMQGSSCFAEALMATWRSGGLFAKANREAAPARQLQAGLRVRPKVHLQPRSSDPSKPAFVPAARDLQQLMRKVCLDAFDANVLHLVPLRTMSCR